MSKATKALTHDWSVRSVSARDLNETMVLVGASGGLSAVYGATPSSLRRGVMRIVTEHGYLYAEKDAEFEVLDEV